MHKKLDLDASGYEEDIRLYSDKRLPSDLLKDTGKGLYYTLEQRLC